MKRRRRGNTRANYTWSRVRAARGDGIPEIQELLILLKGQRERQKRDTERGQTECMECSECKRMRSTPPFPFFL